MPECKYDLVAGDSVNCGLTMKYGRTPVYTMLYIVNGESYPYTFMAKNDEDALSFWALARSFTRSALLCGQRIIMGSWSDKDHKILQEKTIIDCTKYDSVLDVYMARLASAASIMPGISSDRAKYLKEAILLRKKHKRASWQVEEVMIASMIMDCVPFQDKYDDPFVTSLQNILGVYLEETLRLLDNNGYVSPAVSVVSPIGMLKDKSTVKVSAISGVTSALMGAAGEA